MVFLVGVFNGKLWQERKLKFLLKIIGACPQACSMGNYNKNVERFKLDWKMNFECSLSPLWCSVGSLDKVHRILWDFLKQTKRRNLEQPSHKVRFEKEFELFRESKRTSD